MQDFCIWLITYKKDTKHLSSNLKALFQNEVTHLQILPKLNMNQDRLLSMMLKKRMLIKCSQQFDSTSMRINFFYQKNLQTHVLSSLNHHLNLLKCQWYQRCKLLKRSNQLFEYRISQIKKQMHKSFLEI